MKGNSMIDIIKKHMDMLYWQSSSRYDEEVLELAKAKADAIKDDSPLYHHPNLERLAGQLMNEAMLELKHL